MPIPFSFPSLTRRPSSPAPIHLRLRLAHTYLQTSTFIDAKIKWIRDRGLDHAVEKEKNLRPLISLKNLLKSEPSNSLPVSVVADKKHQLGLPTRAITFIRKHPTVFLEFPGAADSRRPHVRLTPQALLLDQEEQSSYSTCLRDTADRLLKLLMLTSEKKLPLEIIDKFKWDMGLPENYIRTLVPEFPDYFQVTGGDSGSLNLELVCYSKELAVSVMEKNAMKSGEYKKGMPLAFPLQYSRGFDLEKKVKKWVQDWQKLPYISPYEDASHLSPKSDLAEKWTVGFLHELFYLFVPRKTEKENLLCLGQHLGLRSRFKRAFVCHPGIFYISNKIRTSTVVLREAYKRDLLVEKHPLMGMRYHYIHLMNKGKEGREKELVKAGKLVDSISKRVTQVEEDEDGGVERDEDLDGASEFESEELSDEDEDDDDDEEDDDDDDDDEDEDEQGARGSVQHHRGSMQGGRRPVEMKGPEGSSVQGRSIGQNPNKAGKVPTTYCRKTEMRDGFSRGGRKPVEMNGLERPYVRGRSVGRNPENEGKVPTTYDRKTEMRDGSIGGRSPGRPNYPRSSRKSVPDRRTANW